MLASGSVELVGRPRASEVLRVVKVSSDRRAWHCFSSSGQFASVLYSVRSWQMLLRG